MAGPMTDYRPEYVHGNLIIAPLGKDNIGITFCGFNNKHPVGWPLNDLQEAGQRFSRQLSFYRTLFPLQSQ